MCGTRSRIDFKAAMHLFSRMDNLSSLSETISFFFGLFLFQFRAMNLSLLVWMAAKNAQWAGRLAVQCSARSFLLFSFSLDYISFYNDHNEKTNAEYMPLFAMMDKHSIWRTLDYLS